MSIMRFCTGSIPNIEITGEITGEITSIPSTYNVDTNNIVMTVRLTNTGNITLTNVQYGSELSGELYTADSIAPGNYVTLTTSYTIATADISDIYFDWFVNANELQETVTGGETVTRMYKLTINYVYENGTPAYDTITEYLQYNSQYSYASPGIPGYTYQSRVVGVITQDTVCTVTYTPNKYTLTIYYRYNSGGTAAPTYSEQYYAGENYSVPSPQIPGYTCSEPVVSGTMPAGGIGPRTIVYTSTGGGII